MAKEQDLVPELGDFVTFTSDLYKTTTGIIIYRDGENIRIRPLNSAQPVVNFPLEPETGLFQASLGVTEVLIHSKRTDPHFSKQLGVLPGERIELLDAEGKPVEPIVTVFEIIATDEYDAIRLTDGRILDFQFLGPPSPYALLRPRAAPEAEAEPGNEEDVEELPEEAFPDIDVALLPAALVEEIPSEERTYSDTIQREDMFVSLLTDLSPERQKDPKIMSRIYRITDVLLAMKNSLLKRDENGAPILGETPYNYSVNTVQEALEKQNNGVPLSALIPIAAVKKVLYTDDDEIDMEDVTLRNDTISLMNALSAANTFSIDKEEGNPFISYINDLLRATAAYVPKFANDGKRISVDQDVIRSQIPPTEAQGFPTTGAAFGKDKPPAPLPLLANALGTVSKTSARLLGPTRIRNPKTNSTYLVAPADSAEVMGHLLVSKELLEWRSPIRTNHLLWDMSNSEVSRSKRKTYTTTANELLAKGDDDTQRTILPEETTSLKDELTRRCGSALQFNSRELVTVTDSLGLRNLELTESLMEPLVNAVISGTNVWDGAFKTLGVAAIERLKTPSVAVVEPLTTVWTDPTLENETIKPVLSLIKQKETTLKDYDLVLANDVFSLAGGTLGPFANGLLGNLDVKGIETEYKNETAREDRNKATQRENAKLLRATPDINTCVHVNELGKIRSIRDDSKRMIMFDKFVKKFSGGQSGNFILCGNCGKDLVCKHEIILLTEFLNPGRSAALHKTLLLDYAGPVFEGAYICKTCGQKIMDLEYDTSLQFDDEGRPLMGRGPIEADEEEEDVALAADAEADIPFKGAQRKLYFQLRALFELCGLALDLDVYKRAVASLNSYIDAFVSTEEAYTASQERAKAAAAKTQKRFTAIPYINFQSTQIIGAVGALAVLELQTNPINVPIAAPGCVLSRKGFPIDGVDPFTAGTGALDYVACALASIKRDDVPWNKVFWSAETDTKRRVEQSKNTILLAVAKILSIQLKGMPAAPVPLDNVTQLYRELMDTARNRGAAATGITDASLSSSGDKLPPAFRPLQRMVGHDTEAIGNVAQFQKNVVSGNLVPVRKLTYERQISLNMKMVAEFHSAAKASGVVQDNNPCSESVCCTKTLAALELSGNGIGSLGLPEGVAKEAELLKEAAMLITRRDPALSNTGTHIYVPWSAPQITNILPTPDESVYYKLFLKNCYRGRKYGIAHELNDAYKCRNCGFMYPSALIYMNQSEITETGKKQEAAIETLMKERERLALDAFSAQGVEINEQKFRDLEEAIRNRKLIPMIQPIEVTKFFDSLEQIKGMLLGCNTSAIEDWDSFVGGMKKIVTEKRAGPQRLGPLVDFSRRYDTLLQGFRVALKAHANQKNLVDGALDNLATITSSTDTHTVLSTLSTQFVVVAQQVATHYKLSNPPVRKWFPKVNRDHAENLKKIWEVFGAVTQQTVSALDDLSETAKPVVTNALLRFAAAFGPILRIWKEELRPTLGFTPEEYTQVLRWTTFTMLSHLTNPNSTFYMGSPSATVTAESVKTVSDWIVLASTTSGTIVKKYFLSDEEIRSRVNARTEQEKAMFIAKLDKQEQEMRKLDLVKKKLKIGDWAIGSQNLFKYNSNMFEFERAQRAAMGLPEFTEEITGPMAVADGANFREIVPEVHGMEEGVLHRAAQDEDEDAGEDAGRLHFVC